MTCEAELHGSVTRMPSSILSDIGKSNQGRNPFRQPRLISRLRQREQLEVVQPLRQLQLMDRQLKVVRVGAA